MQKRDWFFQSFRIQIRFYKLNITALIFASLCFVWKNLIYIFDKDDLNNVVPVPPLDQNDDVPLNAVEQNENADTDVEEELDEFDEESDEEDIFLNEFQIDNQNFDQPNRTQLLCEVPEQANRGRE